MATATLPFSQVGSGLTKTSDIGGSRFGAWSAKAFAPTSWVAQTVTYPINQLSVPPTYSNLSTYGMSGGSSPAAQQSLTASAFSPQSPVFWVVGGLVFLVVMFVLKRKKRIH